MNLAPPLPNAGTLYLIPVPLGPQPAEQVLPLPVRERAATLAHFIAENAKSARAFLKSLPCTRPVQEIHIDELNEHTPASALPALLEPLLSGHDTGLISEAGCPAVAATRRHVRRRALRGSRRAIERGAAGQSRSPG